MDLKFSQAIPRPSQPVRAGQQLQIQVAARTDTGLHRPSNEDSALVGTLAGDAHAVPFTVSADLCDEGVVLAVCDGMGGAAGGEVASREAIDALRTLLSGPVEGASRSSETIAQRLVGALRTAGESIQAHARLEPALKGMGTTATVVVLADERATIGQVGDSRAYLFRQGTLTQLTRDQSLVQLLLEQGRLQPEEVDSFVGSNIILQAVGTNSDLQVDVREVVLTGGDVLLLCSGPVGAAAIASVLASESDPSRACEELIRQALVAGGPDNVTCIVARVVGEIRPQDSVPRPEPVVSEPAEPAPEAIPDPSAGSMPAPNAASVAERVAPVSPLGSSLAPLIAIALALSACAVGWLCAR
jgi:serine/threonine protein phosphatase PrpC